MKDANDNLTLELDLPLTYSTQPTTGLYEFSIETTSGERMVWTHLSLAQAKAMYTNTGKRFNQLRSSSEVRTYSWKEMV